MEYTQYYSTVPYLTKKIFFSLQSVVLFPPALHIFCLINSYAATQVIYQLITSCIRGLSGKCPAIWISRDPVVWPWCNLASSQRRPYCASVNSHSPVGLDSRQWYAVDWACVLCDRRIHNGRAIVSPSSRQCACPFYGPPAGSFWQIITSPRSVSPLLPRFGSLRLLAFPQS
jgi:hypothetical protein